MIVLCLKRKTRTGQIGVNPNSNCLNGYVRNIMLNIKAIHLKDIIPLIVKFCHLINLIFIYNKMFKIYSLQFHTYKHCLDHILLQFLLLLPSGTLSPFLFPLHVLSFSLYFFFLFFLTHWDQSVLHGRMHVFQAWVKGWVNSHFLSAWTNSNYLQ